MRLPGLAFILSRHLLTPAPLPAVHNRDRAIKGQLAKLRGYFGAWGGHCSGSGMGGGEGGLSIPPNHLLGRGRGRGGEDRSHCLAHTLPPMHKHCRHSSPEAPQPVSKPHRTRRLDQVRVVLGTEGL